MEEYWKMRERMNWASAALGRGQDVAQVRTLVEEFRGFYQKWRPVIQVPELCRRFDEMHEQMETSLAHGLEEIFLSHLHEVIEARKDWWMGEQLLKVSIKFIAMMKHSPPPARMELERIHREHTKKEFDPETHYREAEAGAAEAEADFRKALAGLEVDWPERVDAAMRQRLEGLTGADANDWQAEVASKFAKLGEAAS